MNTKSPQYSVPPARRSEPSKDPASSGRHSLVTPPVSAFSKTTATILTVVCLLIPTPRALGQTPVPQSVYPVDLDGDAVSSTGDRIAFQIWVDQGGDQAEALKAAIVKSGPAGVVLDVRPYLDSLLAPKESSGPSVGDAPAGGAQAQAGSIDTFVTILNTGTIAGQAAIKSFKLFKGTAEPSGGTLDWTSFEFNDAAWINVTTTPIGFPGQPFPLNDMQGSYSSFYVRIKFLTNDVQPTINTQLFSSLDIDLGVDDGFVAYLDGQQIRRLNTTGTFTDNSFIPRTGTAVRTNDVTSRVSGYSNFYASIDPGAEPSYDPTLESVLAIQVLNRSLADADCVLSPKIHARKRGPFLSRALVNTVQNPSAHVPTELEVSFRAMPGIQSTVRVEYFINGDPGTLKTSNEVSVDTDTEGFFAGFVDSTMYRVKIPGKNGATPNPAILPETQVTYRVFADGQRFEDDDLTFQATKPFGAAITVVALGNSGIPGTAATNVANTLNAIGADLYLSTGDWVIRNNRYTSSSLLVDDVEPSLNVQAADHRLYNLYVQTMSQVPFYLTPGDEDLETRYSDNNSLITEYDPATVLPEQSSGEPGGLAEKFYSFDYSAAHFLVINSALRQTPTDQASNGPGTIRQFTSEQVAFITDDLTTTKKFWKIVLMHHPPYTSMTRDLNGNLVEDDNDFRLALETDLVQGGIGGLEAFGVDLVISGHEPFFEQSRPVTSDAAGNLTIVGGGPNWVNPAAPVWIVTGGGGENLYQQSGQGATCFPAGAPPAGLANFSWARCRAFHATKITIDENILTIQPVDQNNVVLDIDPGAGTSTSITKTTFPNFRRGDANQDGQVNLSDPVWTNNALFSGGPQPHCWDAVDSNDDGNADLSDSVWTLNFLFQSGPEPPAPGPFTCGPDPTGDSLTCLEYHPSC